MLAGVLMLAAGVLALLGPDAAVQLRSMCHWALAPLGDAGMYLTTSLKGQTRPAVDLTDEQAAALVRENEQLRSVVTTQREYLRRINRELQGGGRAFRNVFSHAFGPNADVPVRLVAARAVATDSLPYGWTRVLNAGSRDHVQGGMLATQRLLLTDREKSLPENLAVLADSALIGRIIEAGAFTARLQLITDAGFATRAHVARVIDPGNPRQVQVNDRRQPLTPQINFAVEAYARGNGTGEMVCDPIPAVHNIRPGDVLQTRGDQALLPVPVAIGRVAAVEDDPEHAGMVIVRVAPLADLPAVRNVYIVVPHITPPVELQGEK